MTYNKCWSGQAVWESNSACVWLYCIFGTDIKSHIKDKCLGLQAVLLNGSLQLLKLINIFIISSQWHVRILLFTCKMNLRDSLKVPVCLVSNLHSQLAFKLPFTPSHRRQPVQRDAWWEGDRTGWISHLLERAIGYFKHFKRATDVPLDKTIVNHTTCQSPLSMDGLYDGQINLCFWQ